MEDAEPGTAGTGISAPLLLPASGFTFTADVTDCRNPKTGEWHGGGPS